MKIIKCKKIALTSIILGSLLIGALIGSGVALADFSTTLNTGWNFFGGSHSDPTWYSYDVSCSEWMSGDQTRVDFDSIRYYNGWGNDTYDPYYADTLVYDKDKNDQIYYIHFSGREVDGINSTYDPTDWVMDELDASNDYVFVAQWVHYGATPCIDYVIAWTDQ